MAQQKRLSPKQVLYRYIMASAFFVSTLALLSVKENGPALFTGFAAVAMAYNLLREVL